MLSLSSLLSGRLIFTVLSMKVGRAARSKPLPLFSPPFPPPLHFLDHSLVAHSPYFSLSPPLPPALPPFLPLPPSLLPPESKEQPSSAEREREGGGERKNSTPTGGERAGEGGMGRGGESYFFLFSYPRPTRREGKRTEGEKKPKKGKSIRASKKPRPVSPPPFSRGRLCHSTPLPATLQAIFCR